MKKFGIAGFWLFLCFLGVCTVYVVITLSISGRGQQSMCFTFLWFFLFFFHTVRSWVGIRFIIGKLCLIGFCGSSMTSKVKFVHNWRLCTGNITKFCCLKGCFQPRNV